MSMTGKVRERFIVEAIGAGISYHTARKLLSIGATLHRLSEAVCNGDYPADNGERKVKACPKCESLWVPWTILKGGCPDCRAQARAVKALEGTAFKPVFQGDPRGGVLMIHKVETPEADIQSGRERGICAG